MTHLQAAQSTCGTSDRLNLRAERCAPTRKASDDASPILRGTFSGAGIVRQLVGSGVTQAVTHIYEVGEMQLVPSRSIANTAHILIEGWAIRSQILRDGARQITDLLVPGDFWSNTLHDDVPSSDIMEACGPARIDAEHRSAV
jgi:hypothetical protein